MTGKTVALQHKTIMMKQLLFLTLALAANLSLRAQTIDTLLYISSVNPIDFSNLQKHRKRQHEK